MSTGGQLQGCSQAGSGRDSTCASLRIWTLTLLKQPTGTLGSVPVPPERGQPQSQGTDLSQRAHNYSLWAEQSADACKVHVQAFLETQKTRHRLPRQACPSAHRTQTTMPGPRPLPGAAGPVSHPLRGNRALSAAGGADLCAVASV